MNPLDDTIIAVATPPGQGGLGVIRLSGPGALAVARQIFRPRRPLEAAFPPRRLVYGELFDRRGKVPLDEAFLVYFRAPNSYTSEDVVELSCHGSPVILEEAMRLGVSAGARRAEAGEFTLRAYLHGRLDLLQAQAVNDLITAVCLPQARLSAGQVGGGLSRKIGRLRQGVTGALALIEAAIEFPEEAAVSREEIEAGLAACRETALTLASTYETGRFMTQGVALAIVGRSNVGKSTLFNALLGEERAIVSPHPGTTRDYLKERLNVGDGLFYLIDMAGLAKTEDPADREAIKRGSRLASGAAGLLIVLDASNPLTSGDLELLKKYARRKKVLAFNKSDLAGKIDRDLCLRTAGNPAWVEVSALKKKNLGRLKALLQETFGMPARDGEEIILHQRQKILLDGIAEAMGAGLDLLRAGQAEELCAEEIRRALPLVGRLTGEIRADDVLADVFRQFCVGK